jgi:hypothetical protein
MQRLMNDRYGPFALIDTKGGKQTLAPDARKVCSAGN